MVTRKEIVAGKWYEICQRVLPRYSNEMGPKTYEFWQLIAMFLYGIVYNLTYRDLEEEFRISEVLRKALNLEKVPPLLNDMQSREEVEGGGFEEAIRRECKTVEREVRYFGSGFYWFERRQFKLLLCEEDWEEEEELD